MITTYRDHGHMLACGMDAKGVMAELTGRRGGYSRGKGGSMHMFSKEKNFYGGHGIVGASVPLGAGLAFANKYRGNDNVCWCYFGDGAANQGQVYETFNMAKLWHLPLIFVIENNRYAMGTSIERSAATTDFSQRGRSFDIPGEQVDGMDVRAVAAAGKRVADWVRAGNGPFILEMLTYRYRGHSMSDPAKYRTREEVDKVREERDPIERVRLRLIERELASEDDLKRIDAEVREIVMAAAEFAQNDPEPDPASCGPTSCCSGRWPDARRLIRASRSNGQGCQMAGSGVFFALMQPTTPLAGARRARARALGRARSRSAGTRTGCSRPTGCGSLCTSACTARALFPSRVAAGGESRVRRRGARRSGLYRIDYKDKELVGTSPARWPKMRDDAVWARAGWSSARTITVRKGTEFAGRRGRCVHALAEFYPQGRGGRAEP